MTNIKSLENIEQILGEDFSVLFCYEQWSKYATNGLKMYEQSSQYLSVIDKIGFWFIDLSNAHQNIEDWVVEENNSGIKLLLAITTGNGSIIWIRKAKIVGYVLNAVSEGFEKIALKTKEYFQ